MTIEYELANTTSRELAQAIQIEMTNEEHDQPPTLGSVLDSLQHGLYQELVATHRVDHDHEQSLMRELEALVENFGDDMLAEYFLNDAATSDLCCALNHLVSEIEPDQPPTLGTLKLAIINGITTHLSANGEMDTENSTHLLEEIEDLIQLHGADTPAEFCLL